MIKFVLLSCIMVLAYSGVSQKIVGYVYDAETGDAMPFVKVSSGSGFAFTDIDGGFELQAQTDSVVFQYVGYFPQKQAVSSKRMIIRIKPSSTTFQSLVITAKEDPAYTIARKVILNEPNNNPLKKKFFYEAYNKFHFSIDQDSSSVMLQNDSSDFDLSTFLEEQYLFLTESVVERYRLSPTKDKKIVTYERTSGLKINSLSISATELQSFSFYDKKLTIASKEFINPISKPGIKMYDLEMIDTVIIDQDSIFTIRYQPKHKTIDGLTGSVKIISNGYAYLYVDAQPLLTNDDMTVHIKQIYAKTEGQWFPSELYSTMHFGSSANMSMVASGRSTINKVNFAPNAENIRFNHLAVDYDKADKTQTYSDELDEKELKTYETIDSLGEEMNLDRKLTFLVALASGKLPIGFIDLELKRIIDFNDFEGFRLGLGASTNDKIAKWFSLGGYGAYAFKDRRWKYGSNLTFKINKNYDTKLDLSYQNDIYFSGINTFRLEGKSLVSNDAFLDILRNRADYVTRYQVSFGSRALKHFHFNIFGDWREHDSFEDYFYAEPLDETVSLLKDNYRVFEIGFETRFAFNEKFITVFDQLVSQGSKSPILNLRVTKGLTALETDYDYLRLDAKLAYKKKFIRGGTPGIEIKSGFIDKSLPLSITYNIPSSYDNFNIAVPNSFETMRFNEFYSDYYAMGVFTYNIGKLYRHPKSATELIFATKALFGGMHQTDVHRNVVFSLPNKGYYESGIYLNNILLSQYYGVGLGILYRHGAYQLEKTLDNFAFKLSIDFSF